MITNDNKHGYTTVPSTKFDISIENISTFTMSSFGNTAGDKEKESERFNETGDRYKAIKKFVASIGLDERVKEKWIEAEKTKIEFSDTGSLTFKAQDKIRDLGVSDTGTNLFLGQKIKINDIAEKFNEGRLITSIVHNIDASGNNGWETTIGYGMSKEWHIEKHPDVMKPPAAALMPGVHGLQVGVIADKPGDLDGEGKNKNDSSTNNKVRVKLYGNQDDKDIINARKAKSFTDANNYPVYRNGTFVLLGFLNDKPNEPVILQTLLGIASDKKLEVLTPEDKSFSIFKKIEKGKEEETKKLFEELPQGGWN